MKSEKRSRKGPWILRFGVKVLAVALAVLLYWLLGFVVDDIGSIRGPDYEEIEKQYIDASLLTQQDTLRIQIGDTKREIAQQRQRMKALSDSTRGLQQTINQLIELQQSSVTNRQALSVKQQSSFEKSFDLFLANQTRKQEINEDIIALVERETRLSGELKGVERLLEEQREPAREAYGEEMKAHRARLAGLKLMVLIPLLLVASFLVVRQRRGSYAPMYYAFAAAVLAKVAEVVHAYFPARLFKYILIAVLIGVVFRLLQLLIRAVVAPGKETLTRQYRDAYARFLCPICEYPIRRGPLKFRYWTRRTVKKLVGPQVEGASAKDESYVCPSCGAALFGECASCHRVRHQLLPYCEHCGDETELSAS